MRLRVAVPTIEAKKERSRMNETQIRSNPAALLPIGVFLVLYLGLGILF